MTSRADTGGRWAIGELRRCAGREGHRRLEQRADVLTYTSGPLEQDLEVVGPVSRDDHVPFDPVAY